MGGGSQADCQADCVAISPDGRWIAGGSRDRVVGIWDAVTGCQLCCLRGHEGAWPAAVDNFPAVGEKESRLRPRCVGQDTVVEVLENARAVAWFPMSFELMATHPGGRVWSGSVTNYLSLIT